MWTIDPLKPHAPYVDIANMAADPDPNRPASSSTTGGFGSFGTLDETGAPAQAFTVRTRFLGDALGWALGAALIIMLGAVGLATYKLLAHEETVAAPLPEFSAQAAAWLAGQQEVAVYRDGHVYLYGRVSSEAERQAMIEMASRALGAENVVADEYFVDPKSSPRSGSTTMRVADPVLFEFNSATIAPGFESVLNFVASVMQQNPAVSIQVIGHTDDIGDDADNLRLSQDRAQAGVAAVITRGGDQTRITGTGVGETQPIASNATEDGRRINRRVEFILSGL